MMAVQEIEGLDEMKEQEDKKDVALTPEINIDGAGGKKEDDDSKKDSSESAVAAVAFPPPPPPPPPLQPRPPPQVAIEPATAVPTPMPDDASS
jgi:hypothetical protein